MNQRLTRKEIKRDELASAVGRGVEYAESHVRTIVYAVGAVLLVAVIAVAVYFWRGNRAEDASAALSKATRVFQAPIQATGAKPNDAETPSFATEAVRRGRAKEMLEKVRADYGSTDAADVAGLYLAQIAADEGKLDDARALWQDFIDEHSDHMLAGETKVNLISLDRQQGKGEKVVQELRAMLEQDQASLPQDVILHELGITLEDLKRPQEAVQFYQRIVDEFPQSPFRMEAQQKASALNPTQQPAAGSPAGGLAGGFPG